MAKLYWALFFLGLFFGCSAPLQFRSVMVEPSEVRNYTLFKGYFVVGSDSIPEIGLVNVKYYTFKK